MATKSVDLETIIDADGHLFEDPEGISALMPARLPRSARPFELGRLFPPLDHLHSASLIQLPPGSFERSGTEGWKRFMGAAGISASVPYPPRARLRQDRLHRLGDSGLPRLQRLGLRRLHAERPALQGHGPHPHAGPAAAVAELRRAVEELGFVGAMLPSTGLKAHVGSPEYWPVFEEAERLGCCLGVHGGCHSGMGLDDMNIYPAVHGPRPPVRHHDSLRRHPHERHLRQVPRHPRRLPGGRRLLVLLCSNASTSPGPPTSRSTRTRSTSGCWTASRSSTTPCGRCARAASTSAARAASSRFRTRSRSPGRRRSCTHPTSRTR